MSPETRAFLDGVRDAEDPTPNDERRVAAALTAALVTGAAAGAGLVTVKILKSFGIIGFSWLKLGGLAVLGVGLWVVVAKPFARSFASAKPVSAPLVATLSTPRAERGLEALPGATVAEPITPSGAPNRAPSKPAARPSPRPETLRDEIALLEDVRAALAQGDGDAALRRLDAHITADRQLLAERRAARILALCQLGRVDEARRSATAFLRDEPTSVQRAAVELSCAGTKTTEER
jgi:RNA polymerase sigma-70 factor (ECF subfamily)